MKSSIVLAVLALLAGCAGNGADPRAGERECPSGVYEAPGSESLVLTPTTSGGYRWRMLDGRTGGLRPQGDQWYSTLGWTGEPDGFEVDLSNCADGELRLGPAGAPASFVKVPVEAIETTFERGGVSLAGRLLLPPVDKAVPLAVFVHGSGDYSSREYEAYPWALAAQGVAAFVYDKRGTGDSQGEYTQDFHVLAADARAALDEARRLAGARASTVGFMGISQGGWVAPLAASEADIDFVAALYGLAVTPLEEDRLEVMQSLARAGWGEAEQARGAELSDAAGVVMASNFRSGFDQLKQLRRQYRDEPWYEDLEGEFTQELLSYPGVLLRVFGPMRSRGTSWTYEPVPVLRSLDVPQFWMIAGDDTEAPPEETIARLRALQAEGKPIDLAIYPGADHGMILTERTETGVRQTGHVREYQRQVARWILTRDLEPARTAGAEVHPATPAP